MIALLIGILGLSVLVTAKPRKDAPVSKPAAAMGAAAIMAAAASFVGPWEGERTEAYLDRIAQPPVWTVCYGETRGVKQGDRYTSEQCKDMLSSALASYHTALTKCIPDLPKQRQGVQVALTSWSYNVGTGAACKSTLVKLANAGDWKGACNQLPRWNKAGGKVVKGLSNRRAAEQKLCLEDAK